MACDLESPPAQVEFRALAGSTTDLKLSPTNSTAYAGAEGFGSRLFCCKTRSQTFAIVFLCHAVGNLARCKDPAQKGFAITLKAVLDAGDLDEVGSESDNQMLLLRNLYECTQLTSVRSNLRHPQAGLDHADRQ